MDTIFLRFIYGIPIGGDVGVGLLTLWMEEILHHLRWLKPYK